MVKPATNAARFRKMRLRTAEWHARAPLRNGGGTDNAGNDASVISGEFDGAGLRMTISAPTTLRTA